MASIARFADREELVEVHRLSTKSTFKATPSNPTFCAMGAWDNRAEAGYMREIEDEFQGLASRIIQAEVSKIDDANKQKVDRSLLSGTCVRALGIKNYWTLNSLG